MITNPWVTVDCKKTGYTRDQFIRYWNDFIKYFFNEKLPYAYVDSRILWCITDDKLRENMTTVWSLKDQRYRTSYQSKIRTFFWVDEKFYKTNRHEILKWAETYNCKVPSKEHGWIEMPNDRVETLFRLIWAGKCYP